MLGAGASRACVGEVTGVVRASRAGCAGGRVAGAARAGRRAASGAGAAECGVGGPGAGWPRGERALGGVGRGGLQAGSNASPSGLAMTTV